MASHLVWTTTSGIPGRNETKAQLNQKNFQLPRPEKKLKMVLSRCCIWSPGLKPLLAPELQPWKEWPSGPQPLDEMTLADSVSSSSRKPHKQGEARRFATAWTVPPSVRPCRCCGISIYLVIAISTSPSSCTRKISSS